MTDPLERALLGLSRCFQKSYTIWLSNIATHLNWYRNALANPEPYAVDCKL